MTNSQNHLYFLNECLKLARLSIQKGNHPFGAILVHKDKIMASSENEVISLGDVTAHAELRLIQKAQRTLTQEVLKRSTLYTSTEPCAMCSGAIYWSEISQVVYGCSTRQLLEVVGEGLKIDSKEILNQSTRSVNVIDYSNEKQFKDLHLQFWKQFPKKI